MCQPEPPEVENPTTEQLLQLGKRRKSKHNDRSMIEKSGGDFVKFVRSGEECFISPTLRKEPNIIDGDLHKELGSKIKRALSGTRKRFVVLDFKKQLVRFKTSRDDDTYSTDKQIPFSQLLDAKVITHDDHKTQPEFHFKMLVQAMARQFIFLARTSQERAIWVDGFQAAIALAKQTEKEQKKQQSMSAKPATTTASLLFHSDNLDVTVSSIAGNVMKRIEKQTIWHRNDYHQRFFKLEFASPFCFFFEEKWEKRWHKSHRQCDIRSCHALTEEEIQEKLEERKRSNSKSLLRSIHVVTHSKWNFGFQLEFPEKTYELYTPTRKERDKWVQILAAIAQMNRLSVALDSMTPLEYLVQDAQRQEQEQLEEQKKAEQKALEAQGAGGSMSG